MAIKPRRAGGETTAPGPATYWVFLLTRDRVAVVLVERDLRVW